MALDYSIDWEDAATEVLDLEALRSTRGSVAMAGSGLRAPETRSSRCMGISPLSSAATIDPRTEPRGTNLARVHAAQARWEGVHASTETSRSGHTIRRPRSRVRSALTSVGRSSQGQSGRRGAGSHGRR